MVIKMLQALETVMHTRITIHAVKLMDSCVFCGYSFIENCLQFITII